MTSAQARTGFASCNKSFDVCVKDIVCLTNVIAEIDTDAHYVYLSEGF